MLALLKRLVRRAPYPAATNRDFVNRLYRTHGRGLRDVLARVHAHNVGTQARLGLSGGSTGDADCGLLHLLVKTFKPQHIFEVGTYIGTSTLAMALAARAYGGKVTTCDPEDRQAIPEDQRDVIRFLHAAAPAALADLKARGESIDFVFADWTLGREAIEILNEIGSPNLIFTAHDYVLPRDKGVINKEEMSQYYRRARECTWILPDPQPILVEPGLALQQATAMLVPKTLVGAYTM